VRVFSRRELHERANLLSTHAYCQHPADIAFKALDRLKPRVPISTLEYSKSRRIVRKPDGTKTGWSQDLTPALVPIMEAHDDPEILEIVAPKPGRCGGTMVAENHALKRLENGPTGDIMWYLAGPEEVRSYADRVLEPIFEDHAGIKSRIGTGKSDNNKTRKRVGGQTFELMVMSSKTTTNRQAAYIVFDEPDSYTKAFRSNFLEQGRQRQRMLGNDRKIYACAHPDIGWSGGIAAAWVISTQGIFIMRCPHCGTHGSPYPTKFWKDVPRFRLSYESSPEGAPVNERLARAEATAYIACPSGCALDEADRAVMIAEGSYMHKGQVLDIEAGITGEPDSNRTWGFWIHVLMAPQVGIAELARELEGALEHKERTGKVDKLKQVMIRTFGEVFEGANDASGLDATALKRRTADLAEAETAPVGYRMGSVPKGVRFLILSIDVGGGKFDLLARGFDLDRRSWVIDRRTIRQRMHADGVLRDIAPGKVQDDWDVLIEEIDRLYPLQDDPGMALPIAVTTIDASDGNVTWKAYEFARRMDNKRWGDWRKVRCIKGATTTKAPQLPPTPTKISKDSEGKLVKPVVTLHVLGVHSLKEDAVEDLAIDDGSPGHCFFPRNMPDKAYEELFNEVLIDGAWVRNGPNETLDLFAYSEAGRLMLEPDRKDRNWTSGKEPSWARPVPLHSEGGDQSTAAGEVRAQTATPSTTMAERFAALGNRRN
jgi:phage terminase large subunit GpA-like protein